MSTHSEVFDSHLKGFFKDALRMMMNDPDKILFFWRLMQTQRKASKKRNFWLKQDIEIPPVMIMSITKRCNLHCKGCYSFAHKSGFSLELPIEKYKAIFDEARELGISIIMMAGGEPLVRKDIIELAGSYTDILFPVFTNGLLLQDDFIPVLSTLKNVIPVISIEGDQPMTDERRGEGVYGTITAKMEMLRKKNIFFGSSITVTSKNIHTVTSDEFISDLRDKGVNLFMFIEYVPAEEKSEYLVLNPEQKTLLMSRIEMLRARKRGLYVGFPGNEEKYGGCLAAGRGFIHVNPEGRIEPCPFAPFSDKDINELTLKDALKSDLLKTLRENHHLLKETNGGCALWSNKVWVEDILAHP